MHDTPACPSRRRENIDKSQNKEKKTPVNRLCAEGVRAATAAARPAWATDVQHGVCVCKKAGGRAKQSSSLDKKGHILTNAIKKNQDFNKRFSITLKLFIQRNNKTFRQLFLWIMSSSKQKCLTMSQFSFVDVCYLSCRIENIREMYYRFEGWIRRLKALGNCDISDNRINLLKNLIILEKNVVAKLWIHLHYPASKLVRICYFSLIYMTNIKSVGVWTVDLNTLPWAL